MIVTWLDAPCLSPGSCNVIRSKYACISRRVLATYVWQNGGSFVSTLIECSSCFTSWLRYISSLGLFLTPAWLFWLNSTAVDSIIMTPNEDKEALWVQVGCKVLKGTSWSSANSSETGKGVYWILYRNYNIGRMEVFLYSCLFCFIACFLYSLSIGMVLAFDSKWKYSLDVWIRILVVPYFTERYHHVPWVGSIVTVTMATRITYHDDRQTNYEYHYVPT